MIALDIKITDKASERLDDSKFRRKLGEAVNKIAFLVERGAKISATKLIYMSPISKSGYRRTGFLRNNIKAKPYSTSKAYAEVISQAPYSIYVHQGTRYMRARPYMEEGIKEVNRDIKDILKDIL